MTDKRRPRQATPQISERMARRLARRFKPRQIALRPA